MERHKSRGHLQEEDGEGHLKCSEDDCDKMFVSRLVKITKLLCFYFRPFL